MFCVCVCVFFSGGYENFHSQYPELCTEVKTIDQSGTETEKRVNSHSEKLSHCKPDYDQVWKHPLQHSASHPCLPTQPQGAQPLPVFIFISEEKALMLTSRETQNWHQHIKTFSQLSLHMIFCDLQGSAARLYLAQNESGQWCPADTRTPHKKTLSYLTFLLSCPPSK